MTGQEVAFLVLAAIGGLAGLLVVTARNVVHAALYLVVALSSVAGVYLLLAAPFVAFVQVIIYVGAIVVLLLFALMLTRAPIGRDTLDNQQRLLALITAVGVLVGLIFLIQGAFGSKEIEVQPTRAAEVGASLFSGYVLPFEVVSVLLLAALIGAVVLARKGDTE